jgi:toxin ParE1/3/4
VRLYWSKRADADLIAIWRHVAPDSERAADALLDRLQARCKLLVQFPELGPLRGGRRLDVRQLGEGEYLIFYRINGLRIEILRVLHGRRDLGAW